MPSELESALRSCGEGEDRVGGLIDGQDSLLSSASQLVHDSRSFTTDNQAALTDIACVRGVVQYTVWLTLMDDLSGELEDAVNAGNDREAVAAYERIKEVQASLKGSECTHLVSYSSSLVEHWYKVIYDRFEADLEKVVKALGWPFVHTGEPRNLAELTGRGERREPAGRAGGAVAAHPEAGPGDALQFSNEGAPQTAQKTF